MGFWDLRWGDQSSGWGIGSGAAELSWWGGTSCEGAGRGRSGIKGQSFSCKESISWKRSLPICRLLRNCRGIFHLHNLLQFFRKGTLYIHPLKDPTVVPHRIQNSLRSESDPVWLGVHESWMEPKDFMNELPETIEFCVDTPVSGCGEGPQSFLRSQKEPLLAFRVR